MAARELPLFLELARMLLCGIGLGFVDWKYRAKQTASGCVENECYGEETAN
jgi:hypothetical protein